MTIIGGNMIMIFLVGGMFCLALSGINVAYLRRHQRGMDAMTGMIPCMIRLNS